MKRSAGALFLFAAVGIALEVVLTRIFSLMFQYHFVFLAVSLAILGLGIGAAAGYAARRTGRLDPAGHSLTVTALALSLLMPVAAWALAGLRSVGQVYLAAGIVLVPFALLGLLSALIFARFPAQGALLYGADLLGAAAGIAGVMALLHWFSPFEMMYILGALAALAAGLLARQLIPGALLGAMLAGGGVLLGGDLIAFAPAEMAGAPPDKTMLHVLQSPGARLLETRWHPFARVDLVAVEDPSVRYIFTDAGAGSTLVRYDGDPETTAWLKEGIEYLPFIAGDIQDVLVLGAGAGKDVLMAHLAGAGSITAVEINPAIVEMTRAQADYSGGVFDLEGVEVVITDARNFVERSRSTYDLIYLNIVYTQAAAPGTAALAENYVFTTEALAAYWSHLAEEGRVGMVTHSGVEAVRLLIAALDMLRAQGMALPEATQHVALVMTPDPDPYLRASTVVVSRQAWAGARAAAFAAEAQTRGLQVLFLPTVEEFALERLVTGADTLETYIADNPEYNYTPPTDDRPFFYHLDPGLPRPLSNLVAITAFLMVVYVALIGVAQPADSDKVRLLLFFVCLGAGFMLVEVPLIQRFGLLLGDPVAGLVAVVGGLLVGGSAGSFFSARFPADKIIWRAALAVSAWVIASLLLYPALVQVVLPASAAVRLVVTVLALLPLGFLMGMPFPGGLRRAGRVHAEGIPSYWGANAIASVFGSALALALAVGLGFHWALASGAVLYVAAAALSKG